LTLGEQQYFCVGRRFSRHKMIRYAKYLGGNGPLGVSWLRHAYESYSNEIILGCDPLQFFPWPTGLETVVE